MTPFYYGIAVGRAERHQLDQMEVAQVAPTDHRGYERRLEGSRCGDVVAVAEACVTLPGSDFCQRWRDRRHSWRHRSEGGFDARRYDVAPLIEADARAFVEVNHYAGTYPAARLRFGLTRDRSWSAWLYSACRCNGACSPQCSRTWSPTPSPWS